MDTQRRTAWLSVQKGRGSAPVKARLTLQLLLGGILFSLLLTQSCFAAIYKCTDDTGRKIFSDTPCVQGTRSVGTINEAQPPAESPGAADQGEGAQAAEGEEIPQDIEPVVITGRVTFANGDPVTGVEVLSWGLKDKQTGFKGTATARTDDDGYYELSIDNRYLWVVYHHGPERREFSRKGPWQSDATVDFIVPNE